MLPTVAAQLRVVAVGTSREVAADVFGEHFENAFFTAYEDFDAEVDLSLLRSVGLVAGDGLSAVLSRVLEPDNPQGVQVLIGLPAGTRHRDIVRRLLESHPNLACRAVLRTGEHVLLSVESTTEFAPGNREDILDQLEPVGGQPVASPVSPPASTPPVRPADSHSPPPRQGRSRRLVVGAGMAALAAVVVLVILIALTWGASALLISVVVVLALSQVLVLAALVHVVGQLHQLSREMDDQRRREARFRARMRRRTDRIVQLQRQHLALGQGTRSEVTQVRNRVMALGKLLGRAGAASRQEHDCGSPPGDGD